VVEEQSGGSLLRFEEGYEHFGDSFERTVDDKGRLVLPSGPQRDAFEGRAWLTPWKGSVALWTRRSYGALLLRIEEQERDRTLPENSVEAIRRSTVMVSIDGQGRFGIPAALRESRGIGGHGSKVVVEGQGDRLEIRAIEHPDPMTPDTDTVVGLTKHR
jgi:DNA-binding transcriptional regulator/RsmH inhibitor MraZ